MDPNIPEDPYSDSKRWQDSALGDVPTKLGVPDKLYEGVTGIPEPNVQMPGGTVIDKLTPTQLYFGQQLATNAKYMNRSTDYLPLFTQGVGPDEIYQRERKAEQANQITSMVMDFKDKAEQFVTQNVNLKEKDYEAAKDKFLAEQEINPERKIAARRAPGALEIGIALFGAAMNPHFAANIMATPFQARDDNYRRNQANYDQQYEDDLARHRERLTALGRLVQFAQEDMQEAQAKNAKLAESINKMLSADKPGIPTLALQEAIAAGLPQERIEMYRTIAQKREESLAAEERLREAEVARKEAMTNAQIADLTSKANERDTMLPGKVAQQGARTEQIKSQTAVNWAREDEIRTLTPEKRKKLQSEIESATKRNKLVDAQAQLVQKKVANYDAEFKVRAANIYSQISKRASDAANRGTGDVRKYEDQEIADLNRLIGINRAQIERIKGAGTLDLLGPEAARIGELQRDIDVAQNRVKQIVEGRQGKGGAPLIGPIGSGAPKYNPDKERMPGVKPRSTKPFTLPPGWSGG